MKEFRIYIIIGSVLLLVYLVAQYNKPNPVNWASSLSCNDKVPFGTYVLYNRLHDLFPDAAVSKTNASAYKTFSDTTLEAGSYLITANNVSLNKEDYKAMSKYISKGNTVFISTFDFDGVIADTLKLNISNEFGKRSPGINFTSPSLKQGKDYSFDKHIADQYFKEFDTTKAVILGRNEYGHANFISYQIGKGNLYLMANPQLLSNYNLLKPQGAAYAAAALSYLPANVDYIYWDQYQNHDIPIDESPMRVFFRYPALQWAYYLALASLLIFVIYEVKRRQRIIPVVEPLKNTTLEFVNVVGRVYYEQRSNVNIASKKILYLSDHLRTTYNLKPGGYHQDFVPILAAKTGIDPQFADELVRHVNYMLPQSRITDHELIILNQLIEKFYTQSGS